MGHLLPSLFCDPKTAQIDKADDLDWRMLRVIAFEQLKRNSNQLNAH